MSIEFLCQSCGQTLRVPEESAGKKCRCPSCQSIAPVPRLVAMVPVQSKVSHESLDASLRELHCPRCTSSLRYAAELEGTRGMCKGCGFIFTLGRAAQASGDSHLNSFAFECPSCKFMFEGKSGMEGKKGKCTECGGVFPIVPIEKPMVPAPQLYSPTPTTPTTSTPVTSNRSQKPGDYSISANPHTEPITKAKSPVASGASPPPRRGTSQTHSQPVSPAIRPSPAPSVWDELNLPTSNWDAAAQSAGTSNPYAVTASAAPRRKKKKTFINDRDTLYTIAYWHRAVVVSFVSSLVIAGLNLSIAGLMFWLQSLSIDKETLDTIAFALGIIQLTLGIVALVMSIRFYIGYIILCINLYDGLKLFWFIAGFFFLFCVPFAPLIFLIVVMSQASLTLRAGGYRVGFFGVDPNDL